MPKPTDSQAMCTCCGLPRNSLVDGQCQRCNMLYGPPPKPANGRPLRSTTSLDHSSFRERLHFVINQSQRVH